LINDTTWPALDIKVIPGQYSEPTRLRMNWTFISFTERELKLQLNFDKPNYVSSNRARDSIAIVVYGYPWFISADLNYMRPGYSLTKGLPRLTSKAEAKTAIYRGIKLKEVETSILLGSTLINILVAGPLQQILDAIKSAQIILHLMLINVPTPAAASLFFS
jgi:hypothetical protein